MNQNLNEKNVNKAIANRIQQLNIQPREGNYCYNGSRTNPESLPWRVRQNWSLLEQVRRGELRQQGFPAIAKLDVNNGVLKISPTAWNAEMIERGFLDSLIIETFHDAASAEYWYRYEKDYG